MNNPAGNLLLPLLLFANFQLALIFYYCACHWRSGDCFQATVAVGRTITIMNGSLPTGWSEHQDLQGVTFYFNAQKNESTYERPSPTSPPPPPPPPPPPTPLELPAAWSSHLDPVSGKTFFFNVTTGERKWESPVSPPAPPPPQSRPSHPIPLAHLAPPPAVTRSYTQHENIATTQIPFATATVMEENTTEERIVKVDGTVVMVSVPAATATVTTYHEDRASVGSGHPMQNQQAIPQSYQQPQQDQYQHQYQQPAAYAVTPQPQVVQLPAGWKALQDPTTARTFFQSANGHVQWEVPTVPEPQIIYQQAPQPHPMPYAPIRMAPPPPPPPPPPRHQQQRGVQRRNTGGGGAGATVVEGLLVGAVLGTYFS